MVEKEPFDRNQYYKGIKGTVAEASGGRGSRIIDPILEEDKAKKKTRPPEQKTASYRIGQDLKDRVDEISENYNVEKGSLVRALLTFALDELESGAWALPSMTGKRKLDV